MSDWIGLGFFVLVVVGAAIGLKRLAKPVTRTEEEFERNAAESYSRMGASVNALQGILDPSAAKGKETLMQMKDGQYQKKKQEGKTAGDAKTE